jgi:hypothetical protein
MLMSYDSGGQGSAQKTKSDRRQTMNMKYSSGTKKKKLRRINGGNDPSAQFDMNASYNR